MLPSGSTPLPVKVTVCPTVEGLGVMEVMVAVGGVFGEEDEVYVILSSALLASLSSEKSACLTVVLASIASEALSPKAQVESPPSRHQVISETAALPRGIQFVQDPEEGSGKDA
jgi:hypothetical protein